MTKPVVQDAAIRTVSETDDIHVIEGLGYPFGGPFNGSDSYGTRFTAQTNFHWDLYPDTIPTATRSGEPKFIRPLTYQHGFDAEIGLVRNGGWSPVRMDDRGVWVQAQLDKHSEYYGAIRDLLGANALAFSGESAEHAVRIAKSGEILEWPAGPLSLTPVPSNPWAQIAARSEDTLRIVAALRKDMDQVGGVTVDRDKLAAEDFAGPDRSFPITDAASVEAAAHLIGKADNPDEVKANIIRIAKSRGLTASLPAAWVGPAAKSADLEAFRVGKTISAATSRTLMTAHDAIASTLGMDCGAEPDADDAARSAETIPVLRVMTAPVDADAFRAQADGVAALFSQESSRKLSG